MLSYEDILGTNIAVCNMNNQKSIVINEDNVKSAIGSTQWFDTPEKQASALLRSLIVAHGFQDGNKRTAVISMIKVKQPKATEDEMYDITIAIAKGMLKNVDDISLLLYGR